MQKLTPFTGLVVPLDRSNVDTDAIIPKQFLSSLERTGYGDFVFDQWRYQDHGQLGMDCRLRPKRDDFVLNLERYQNATILLAQDNFGCGSSREHAVWGLVDYGFKAVIAPSFADIFFQNCFKNGLLAIVLDKSVVEQLFNHTAEQPGYALTINLAQQTVETPDNTLFHFEIEPQLKNNLLNGLDEIGATLTLKHKIHAYEAKRAQQAPWLFKDKS